MYISVTCGFVYKNLCLIQIGFRPCLVCLIWRVLGDSPISSSSSSGDGDDSSSSSGSSDVNSILIVITIVCNITWVNITFVIVIISNGAGDVGRKAEVIDV
jgi:preprotein translocase subunit SecG